MTTVVTIGQGWLENRLGDRRGAEAGAGFWDRLRGNLLSVRGATDRR
jgi:hypothetical protein